MAKGGFGLGGTKIEAVVIDDNNQVVGQARQSCGRDAPSSAVPRQACSRSWSSTVTSDRLGAGAASAINLIDLEAVVIGGGLGTRLGEVTTERIRQAMLPHLFVSDCPPDARLTELGDLGGAIGAARLVPTQ